MVNVMDFAEHKPSYKVNLKRQQSLCERNYYKIVQLLAELKCGGPELVDDSCLGILLGSYYGEAHFKVLERAPFTTVIEVKLQAEWGRWLALPHFRVRIYHDVKMAEIISINKDRHFQSIYSYPNEKMLQPDEKEQLNTLFSEWLNVCLKHGYSTGGFV